MKTFKHDKGFDIGTRIRIIGGNYIYTRIGSEGIIERFPLPEEYPGEERATVRFYKMPQLTANPVYDIHIRNMQILQ